MKKEKLTFYLPTDLIARIRAEAKAQDRTISGQICWWINKGEDDDWTKTGVRVTRDGDADTGRVARAPCKEVNQT